MAETKVRRDGITLSVEIGLKSKAKTWEDRAKEMHDLVVDLQVKHARQVISNVSYASAFRHFLEEYKYQLMQGLMEDLDIPVWLYGRLQDHIDKCKPNKHE